MASGALTVNGTLGVGVVTSTGDVIGNSTKYYLEGGTSRNVMRSMLVTVTGLTDDTQCTAETADQWNGHALAVETIDSDTPTGGTRFNISSGGKTITIKGLPVEVIGIVSITPVYNSSGILAYDYNAVVTGGDIGVTGYDPTTAAALDFNLNAELPNATIIKFIIVYVTST